MIVYWYFHRCFKKIWLSFYSHFRIFFLIQRFKQPLSAFLHFYQPWLQPLPQLIVFCSSRIRWVPHIVFDELFNSCLPLLPQHVLLNAFDSNHQSAHILDEDIISSNQQLFILFWLFDASYWRILIGVVSVFDLKDVFSKRSTLRSCFWLTRIKSLRRRWLALIWNLDLSRSLISNIPLLRWFSSAIFLLVYFL